MKTRKIGSAVLFFINKDTHVCTQHKKFIIPDFLSTWC